MEKNRRFEAQQTNSELSSSNPTEQFLRDCRYGPEPMPQDEPAMDALAFKVLTSLVSVDATIKRIDEAWAAEQS